MFEGLILGIGIVDISLVEIDRKYIVIYNYYHNISMSSEAGIMKKQVLN